MEVLSNKEIYVLLKILNDKKVKEGLANGTIDIVIGTHALLSDNVKFKNY